MSKARLHDGTVELMSDEDILRMVVAFASEKYSCLRGPRPSSALIITEDYAVFGNVAPPQGSMSCEDCGECMIEDGHCTRNNHAEVDALLSAARNGVPVREAVCYTINKPCYPCTRALIAAGISKIIYAYAVYDEMRTSDALKEAGVECVLCQI